MTTQQAGDWAREREQEDAALLHVADKRVVTIGGGTGSFTVLSRLKRYPCQITAIVTMSDSGGSSRRLMDEFGQLPVGDLRQALVALSRKGALWREAFTFRFREGNGRAVAVEGETGAEMEAPAAQAGVGGHALGNLILSALQEINEGDLLWGIRDAQELLDTAGQVLPVTLEHTSLYAELEDGQIVRGESAIDTRGEREPGVLSPVRRVFLEPAARGCAEALRAIRRADVIVLGPGDLYTSILPNLLVEGVAEAIRASEAQKVYVCNLMTKHGETDGYRASDFVRRIHEYLGERVDRVILHDGSFPEHLVDEYAAKAQRPVEADASAIQRLVPEVVVEPLLAVHGETLVRHDAARLVSAIFAPHHLDALTPARDAHSLAVNTRVRAT
jgi:uncharacterized cofD-like protein